MNKVCDSYKIIKSIKIKKKNKIIVYLINFFTFLIITYKLLRTQLYFSLKLSGNIWFTSVSITVYKSTFYYNPSPTNIHGPTRLAFSKWEHMSIKSERVIFVGVSQPCPRQARRADKRNKTHKRREAKITISAKLIISSAPFLKWL